MADVEREELAGPMGRKGPVVRLQPIGDARARANVLGRPPGTDEQLGRLALQVREDLRFQSRRLRADDGGPDREGAGGQAPSAPEVEPDLASPFVERFARQQERVDLARELPLLHENRPVLDDRPVIGRQAVVGELGGEEQDHHGRSGEGRPGAPQGDARGHEAPRESGAEYQERQPELVVVRGELPGQPNRDRRRQAQGGEQDQGTPASDHRAGQKAGDGHHEQGERPGPPKALELEWPEGLDPHLRGETADVEAVVLEDGAPEVPEPPLDGEVAQHGRPRGHTDCDDDQDVGDGPMPRAPLGRRNDVREGEERGRGDGDLLVERGEGEQGAHRDEAPRLRRGAGAQEQGESPDQTRIDEDLGVGLVGLHPQVAGDDGPEGGGPEADGGPVEGGGDVDREQGGEGSGDVEEVDRGGAGAGDGDDRGMREMQGRRLVVPDLGVEASTLEQLAADHRRARDVRLEGLVVGVCPRRDDRRAQEQQDEDLSSD